MFHLIQIPTPVIVRSPTGHDTVSVRFRETSGQWKSGLDIDYFELRPAPPAVQAEWQRWVRQVEQLQAASNPLIPPFPEVVDPDAVLVLPDPNASPVLSDNVDNEDNEEDDDIDYEDEEEGTGDEDDNNGENAGSIQRGMSGVRLPGSFP